MNVSGTEVRLKKIEEQMERLKKQRQLILARESKKEKSAHKKRLLEYGQIVEKTLSFTGSCEELEILLKQLTITPPQSNLDSIASKLEVGELRGRTVKLLARKNSDNDPEQGNPL